MGSDPISLAAGDAQVEIAPGIGGAIAAFRWREYDVLRPTPDDARSSGDVRQFACYPLVPYSNRIADATLRLHDGTTHALARNFGDHPHAIHGVGWQRDWSVKIREPADALLTLEHQPDGDAATAWPYAFRALQSFALDTRPDAAMLTMKLAIENTDACPFPFGLGWHPFFPRDAVTQLGFSADGVWQTDATCLPTHHIGIPDAWRFDPPRAIGATALDNVFTGWTGRASLAWPQCRLEATVEADSACDHLVVFVPPGRDFLAVEPVTHMTDAFNRAARGASCTGMRLIGPGQSYCCTMSIVASIQRPPKPA
ncbi:MAG: aldose 1-epimerase [Casimicrobiaceae bacterium]